MKKQYVLASILFAAAMLLCGCGIKKQEEGKGEKVEYTVVSELEIPEELKKMIEEKKPKPFQMSFASENTLYLAVGYGEQPTGGYSIVVERLEETPEVLYFETNFMGPDKEEKVSQRASFPYLVIKMDFRDKEIYYE